MPSPKWEQRPKEVDLHRNSVEPSATGKCKGSEGKESFTWSSLVEKNSQSLDELNEHELNQGGVMGEEETSFLRIIFEEVLRHVRLR